MLLKRLSLLKNNIIFKNWSLLTVANVFQQLIIFVTFIRIARLLGPEQFGKFSSIVVIAGIGQVIATLGFNKILVREVARNPQKIANIAKASLKPLFFAIILSVVILSSYTYFVSKQQILIVITTLPILLFSLTLWNYFEAFAFGLQNMKISAILNIFGFSLLAVLIFALPANLFELIIIVNLYVLIHFVRAFGYIYWAKKESIIFPKTFVKDESISVNSILKKSLPYWLTKLLSIPTMQLPILFLEWNSDVKEVGYFFLSTKLAMPITLIITNLLNALFPMFSKKFLDDYKGFKILSEKVFIIIFLSGAAFALVTGLFSKEIILFIWGDAYFKTIQPFAIQVWSVVIILLLSLFGTLFVAADQEKNMVKISIINGSVIGIATFIGSFYGAYGLAIGFWIGYTISFAFDWYFLNKWVGVSFAKSTVFYIVIGFLVLSIGISTIVLKSFLLRLIIFLMFVLFGFLFKNKLFKKQYFSIK